MPGISNNNKRGEAREGSHRTPTHGHWLAVLVVMGAIIGAFGV